MATWADINKSVTSKQPVKPASKAWSAFNTTMKDKAATQESTSQTVVDSGLFKNLKLQGESTKKIKEELQPEKVSYLKTLGETAKDTFGGFFSQMSRNVKAGFDVLGGTIAAGVEAKLPGSQTGQTPKELFDTGKEMAKKTITTPGAPGIGTATMQAYRFASRAAATPLAAVFALPKGGVTPKEAFKAGAERTLAVATEEDSMEKDWQAMSDMYLEHRKLGPYGKNEPTTGDIAALTTLQMFNFLGDVGAGAVDEVTKLGRMAEDAIKFKKVGTVERALEEGNKFVGKTRELEIPLSKDFKIKVKPTENSIVFEGYKRRFPAQAAMPDSAMTKETQDLVSSIRDMTGQNLKAKFIGDDLQITPKLLEGPKPRVPGAPVQGDGFVMTDKVNKEAVAQMKLLNEFRAESKKFTQQPTTKQLNKVLALRDEMKAMNDAAVPAQGTGEGLMSSLAKQVEETGSMTKTDIKAMEPEMIKPAEQIPTAEPKAASEFMETMKPVGEGEVKTSRLSKGVEAAAVEKKLVESFEDLPEYKTANMKDQAEKAAKIIAEDPDRAVRVALGFENAPEGVIPESVFVAVEEAAIKNGDIDLLRQLSKSQLSTEATAMGQRIRALGERNVNSPIDAIREVTEARTAAFEKKKGKAGKGNRNAKSEKRTTAKEIRDEMKKTRPKKEDWETFIKNIQCK